MRIHGNLDGFKEVISYNTFETEIFCDSYIKNYYQGNIQILQIVTVLLNPLLIRANTRDNINQDVESLEHILL